MIRQKPEPKNAAAANSKQVRRDAKILAAPVATSKAPRPVAKRAKQTDLRPSDARHDKPAPAIKPKRDRAEYMRKYRRDQIAELARLRELVGEK